MTFASFLRKELFWSRRRAVALLLLFVVLPGAFAYSTVAFNTVLPTDTPVAVVPQSEAVGQADIGMTQIGLAQFTDPTVYETQAAARSALSRERVYAIVTVPPNLTESTARKTFHVYVDGSVVPYQQPSKLVVSVMRFVLRERLDAGVDIQRHILGQKHTLSEYLVPTLSLALVMLLALAYVPHNLAGERAALERLRVEASLESMLGAKLAFFAALLVAPVLVFTLATAVYGYRVAAAAPGAVAVYALTFLFLAAFASAVTLLTRFSAWGRLLNVVVLFFLLTFSGLVYPAGFFSPDRRELVRLLPTHYAAVAARGFTLRDAGLGTYDTWLLGLAALVVAALGLLKLAVVHYERGT